jgi:hypothetical protein
VKRIVDSASPVLRPGDERRPDREAHVDRAPSAGRVAFDPNGTRAGSTSVVGPVIYLFPVADCELGEIPGPHHYHIGGMS